MIESQWMTLYFVFLFFYFVTDSRHVAEVTQIQESLMNNNATIRDINKCQKQIQSR